MQKLRGALAAQLHALPTTIDTDLDILSRLAGQTASFSNSNSKSNSADGGRGGGAGAFLAQALGGAAGGGKQGKGAPSGSSFRQGAWPPPLSPYRLSAAVRSRLEYKQLLQAGLDALDAYAAWLG